MSEIPVPPAPGLTLLIADDSAVMRAMIKRVIGLVEAPIATILEAADGKQALALLEQHEVAVLFTDINMPEMTGTELLREIERRGSWPHLLRVIISTDGSSARREEADELKARFYLQKPFRPEAMRDVLDALTSHAD
jgi:CheY-like chemotaxis protein